MVVSLVLVIQLVTSRSLHIAMEKTKREMTPQGFYGDTFSDGFGGFRTMKRREPTEMKDIEADI